MLYEVVMGAIIADLGVLGSPEPHGIVTVNSLKSIIDMFFTMFTVTVYSKIYFVLFKP